jgi:hypothetical protein
MIYSLRVFDVDFRPRAWVGISSFRSNLTENEAIRDRAVPFVIAPTE